MKRSHKKKDQQERDLAEMGRLIKSQVEEIKNLKQTVSEIATVFGYLLVKTAGGKLVLSKEMIGKIQQSEEFNFYIQENKEGTARQYISKRVHDALGIPPQQHKKPLIIVPK